MGSIKKSSLGRVAWATLLIASATFADASVLDFNAPELVGVYLPGESFVDQGFRLTQRIDAGVIDFGSSLGGAAPLNNLSQFYTAVNDGQLGLTRVDGQGFSLDGLAAAYVPQLGAQNDPYSVVLIAQGVLLTGEQVSARLEIGNTSATTTGSAFLSFGSSAEFSLFRNLASVEFFTCVNYGGVLCTSPNFNNGQFALDDIRVSAVPEPSAWGLMAAGLIGIGAIRRRVRIDGIC